MDHEYRGNHPWDVFLEARKKVIHWMYDEFKRSDKEISEVLSTTEIQINLIRTWNEK